jgi:hypothetical protein
MSKPRSARTRRAPSRRAIVNNTPAAVGGVVLTLAPAPFLEGSTIIVTFTGGIGEWTADVTDIPRIQSEFVCMGFGENGLWEPLVINSATTYEDGGKTIFQLTYNWVPGVIDWSVFLSVATDQQTIRGFLGGGIAGFGGAVVSPLPQSIGTVYCPIE